MKGPKAGGAVPSDYLQLVRDFPLYAITSDDEMGRAHALIDKVLRMERTPGVDAYLDALSVLVAAYEDQAHPMPDAPEADVLRVLMDGSDLSQPRLAKEVGIAQSTISDVLSGKKKLTRKQIEILAAHFCVAPEAFLPERPKSSPPSPKERSAATVRVVRGPDVHKYLEATQPAGAKEPEVTVLNVPIKPSGVIKTGLPKTIKPSATKKPKAPGKATARPTPVE